MLGLIQFPADLVVLPTFIIGLLLSTILDNFLVVNIWAKGIIATSILMIIETVIFVCIYPETIGLCVFALLIGIILHMFSPELYPEHYPDGIDY